MQKPKKVILISAGIILTPVLLLLLLAIALYIPPVQNYVVHKVAAYASNETGMTITVDRVRLAFPLDLNVQGIKVIQPNDSIPQQKDTVADIASTIVDVQLLPLFSKQVEIDRLEFNQMKFNTTNFIHEARVRGRLDQLAVESHGIDLGAQFVKLNTATLKDAFIDVELSDTVPEDTTPSENFWKIDVEQLQISNTNVTVHMPGDTLQIEAYLGKTSVRNGYFDLYKSAYTIAKLDWQEGRLKYDNNFVGTTSGLDYNHIALDSITIGIDSFSYQAPRLALTLRHCSFREKSGINVTNFASHIEMDSTKLSLPNLRLQTAESALSANVNLDLNAFSDNNPGVFDVSLHGYFGKNDLMMFMGDMPKGFRQRWPNYPLSIDGVVKGNMQGISFTGLNIVLPSAFRINATGNLLSFMNPEKMRGSIKLDANSYNLAFLTSLLPPSVTSSVKIPSGISVKGNVEIDRGDYIANLTATQGGGSAVLKARLNTVQTAFNCQLNANKLPLQNFLPGMGLRPLTGDIYIKGVGTDYRSPRTNIVANARIRSFGMSGYDLSNISFNASLRNCVAHAALDSKNPLLKGLVTLDALTNTNRIRGTIGCDISHINLYKLHITDYPLIAALCGQVDLETDLNDYYSVQGRIGDLAVMDSSRLYRPEDDILLDVLTRRDTTHAIVECGDFYLNLDAQGGYKRLLNIGDKFMAALDRQIAGRYINEAELRSALPLAHIKLNTGRENFFMRILGEYGYQLSSADLNVTSSPHTGLNGYFNAFGLNVDSMQVDTVRLKLYSDANTMKYSGQVRNGKKNPQYVFNLLFDGGVIESGAVLNAKIYDANDRLGISTGLEAKMEQHGLRFSLNQKDNVLGYKTFHVNKDNYLFLADDRRVSARMKLTADDGTGAQIYTNDSTDALQDITLSLHHFDLEKLMSVLPYTPAVSGIMDGDFHAVQTTEDITVSSAINIENLVYERQAMGNVGAEFVYLPKSDGTHHVDGFLTVNDHEVANIIGSYDSKGAGSLDATLVMERTPLQLLNGFIPDQLIGLRGYGEGELSVKGPLSAPQVNGEIYLDSSYLFSIPYGIEMRFDNDPVRIVGSNLLFENFQMYANNNQPLVMSGNLDFSNLDRMMLNLRMRARNFMLIDAKENSRSETFGKAYVNFFAMMQGPVDNLNMRGRLELLGSTDLKYVLRDSPLTTDNQLEGLVDFVDFRDTTNVSVARPPLSGFNMDLTVSVDEGARVMCLLNADHTNYVDLQGGGDLRLQYSASEMRLTGRYTISNGEMKYALPVIPLKTFTVQDGSYVEFVGDAFNPRLNITALEQTKANVGEGSSARSVNFECGVKISKTLKDMGLEFIIDAPDDITLHSQFQAMSVEDRGKVAVTMLTTGMYLADGNTSSFSLNSALSSFLNSQINAISGNALRTLDLTFGMENTTTATGATQTDYSFKFAKRFWNNRLRIVVGGKLSTGSEVQSQNESFFDNVTFEYRLDQNSNKYARLFYNRDGYDWLEGNVGEYGGGFLWRRKVQHFSDIFNVFGKTKSDFPIVQPKDTLRRDTVVRKR